MRPAPVWPTAQQRAWWPQSQESAVHLVLDVGCPSVCVVLVGSKQAKKNCWKGKDWGIFFRLGRVYIQELPARCWVFFVSSSLDCLSVCLGSVFSQSLKCHMYLASFPTKSAKYCMFVVCFLTEIAKCCMYLVSKAWRPVFVEEQCIYTQPVHPCSSLVC